MSLEPLDRPVNADTDDIVVDRPVLATLLVAAIAAVVYAGLQVVLSGPVDPVETAVFVAVFTVVYVGGKRVLHRRAADETE